MVTVLGTINGRERGGKLLLDLDTAAVLSDFLSNNMGWLIAAVPLVACFISNWITMGTSTYYRIHPAICIAPLATLITQALSLIAIVAFIILPFVAFTGSLVLANAFMGIASSLGIVAVLWLTRGEYEARFEGALGWSFVAVSMALAIFSLSKGARVEEGLPFYVPDISNEGLRMLVSCITYRFRIAEIVVASLLDVLMAITLLCVLAYVLGVYYAAHREPRLVDTDNRIMVLSVFSGGACAAARIESIRVDPGKRYPICKVSQARIYRSLSQFDGELSWVRFSKIELNRENAKSDV